MKEHMANLGETIRYIIADLRRWESVSIACGMKKHKGIGTFFIFIKALFLNESFLVLFWFRIGCYLANKRNIIAKFSLLFVKIIHLLNCRWTGIQIPIGTDVGPGLYFDHYSCIVIAATAKIGSNCTIFQGVTIGRTWNNSAPPTIGDNCIICAGAKIIGDVKIGNNVVVGANAVVTKDIPDYSVVAGIPAHIISDDSSHCFSGKWSLWFNLR